MQSIFCTICNYGCYPCDYWRLVTTEFGMKIRGKLLFFNIIGNGFDGTFDNFFKNFHKRIIDHYIMSERVDRTFSRQEGEVQCIYGIQTVAAALQYPKS